MHRREFSSSKGMLLNIRANYLMNLPDWLKCGFKAQLYNLLAGQVEQLHLPVGKIFKVLVRIKNVNSWHIEHTK